MLQNSNTVDNESFQIVLFQLSVSYNNGVVENILINQTQIISICNIMQKNLQMQQNLDPTLEVYQMIDCIVYRSLSAIESITNKICYTSTILL